MIEIIVPDLGESIVEATIIDWVKKEGEAVSVGETVLELETDKVNVEVTANEAGVLQSILKHSGDTVQIGEVLGIIGEGKPEIAMQSAQAAQQEKIQAPAKELTSKTEQEQPHTTLTTRSQTGNIGTNATPDTALQQIPIRATPAIRRLARAQGINLSQIGVMNHTQDHIATPSAPAPAAKQATSAAVANDPVRAAQRPDEERIKMSRRRQTIARRLVEAQHNAAMLTTFNEVDMTAIMDVRKRRKDRFKEKHGVGLGFMSFFTRAVVGALREFPRLNAEIQGDDMIIKHHYDIGIAVSTDAGLVVPVVRNADRLSFAQIESEIALLAQKARSNSLSIEDLQGGTFTITNGGIFGSLFSTPILNAPQVGILGMHSIKKRPIEVHDQVEIRPMMYIALSYDHRIIDGSEAVQFLARVKELAEDPEFLLIEG
ncbi:2-oxoglutarate dehydrogenase complex dihydrolipoyllysine-residue succinyltransferase [Fodinisporobacter ferrooxydans]|uniref:Dihydrolipoyllysine-residue succinyltransferase n=1 Tax=Fodinisporobacter ferrooxydans TaxID=2901836 RepID=A0ABY4CEY5_9BACL|nr:2-oxoglutarate dehydrogenase complex dihydrolipoyllysine-residue succinyltransferase [Alicyclobacillaceae bacterium MYW30-H2]